jgi:hypothetical protein
MVVGVLRGTWGHLELIGSTTSLRTVLPPSTEVKVVGHLRKAWGMYGGNV